MALGVFLRMEYNRNRRFNFVGKGVPLVWSRRKHADCYSDSLLIPSTADPRPWFPACPSPDIVLEPCSRRVLSGRIQCPVFQTALESRLHHPLHYPFSSLLLASLKSQIRTLFIRKWQTRFPPCFACHAASTWAWLRPVHLSGAGNVASGFRCGHELSSLVKRCGGSRHHILVGVASRPCTQNPTSLMNSQ